MTIDELETIQEIILSEPAKDRRKGSAATVVTSADQWGSDR